MRGRRRTVFLVCVLVVLGIAACREWRAAQLGQAAPGREARYGSAFDVDEHVLLVITDDSPRAIELEHAQRTGDQITGEIVHQWRIPDGTYAVDRLESLDPADVAAVLGWDAVPDSAPQSATIEFASVAYARAYVPTGRGVARVGWLTLTGLVSLLIGIAIATTPAASCGRPLRVRGRRCITPVVAATEWIEPIAIEPVPEDVRRVLVDIWTEEAQAEHAAIAAFGKLSLELIALGAPPELVARAHRAALQEVHHAKLCFGLAAAYSGKRLGPAAFPQALAGDTIDIFRIGREALVDGCLREGLAAEIARIGSETVRDRQVARVLRVQANEETQHAALGWAIVEWCIAREGEPMRAALRGAIAESAMPRCDDLPDYGRVPARVVKPLFTRMRDEARARIDATAEQHAA